MRLAPLLVRVGAISLLGFLTWAALPAATHAAAPKLTAVGSAPAAFLQGSGSSAWSTSRAGGSAFGHLPTSAMPFGAVGGTCSVDSTDPGAPPRCSTGAGVAQCSAHCDSQQRCSAFLSAAGGALGACSTLGGIGTLCSVLQPPIAVVGPSQCSAFGGAPGTSIQCSVMGAGRRQICSAQNPANIPQNQCSTFQITTTTGGLLECSVLGGGGANKNYCSVGGTVPPGAAPKFCSAHAINSRCSVLVGNRGACTAFSGAPAGTCSAFAGASSFCSVLGGAPGAFCTWP